jgi:hypothetical protein
VGGWAYSRSDISAADVTDIFDSSLAASSRGLLADDAHFLGRLSHAAKGYWHRPLNFLSNMLAYPRLIGLRIDRGSYLMFLFGASLRSVRLGFDCQPDIKPW